MSANASIGLVLAAAEYIGGVGKPGVEGDMLELWLKKCRPKEVMGAKGETEAKIEVSGASLGIVGAAARGERGSTASRANSGGGVRKPNRAPYCGFGV